MKKKKGIIETLKAAESKEETIALTKKFSKYDYASLKTARKFARILRKKRLEFNKNQSK
jgi:hypothetical protein